MRLRCAEQSHRRAIGKNGTYSRVSQRINGGVGVSWRVHNMTPVKQRRYARVDLIECSYQVSDIDILGRIQFDDLPNQHPEIMVKRPIRSNATQCSLPEMNMPVN